MSSAYIPLYAMAEFTADTNSYIFKNLTVPSGIDKDLLIDAILLRCGSFEVLYSDAEFMQAAINVWSRKWYLTFDKWYKALQIKYDPLNNYDRYEVYTDKRTEKTDGNYSTNSGSDGTQENQRSAYDSSTYQPNEKDIVKNSATERGQNNNNLNGLIEHDAHLWGNIGVTTSQQMLESELSIAEWNLYEHIADLFTLEFTLPIY